MNQIKKYFSLLAISLLLVFVVLWVINNKETQIDEEVAQPKAEDFEIYKGETLEDGVYILSDETKGELLNFSKKYNVPMKIIRDADKYKNQLSSVEYKKTTLAMIEDGVEVSRAVVVEDSQSLEYILVSAGVLNFTFVDDASNIFKSLDQEELFLLELTDSRCLQCMENSDVIQGAANEKVLPYAQLDIGNIYNKKITAKDGRIDLGVLNVLPTYVLFNKGVEVGRVEGVKNVDSLSYFIEEYEKKEPHN